MNELAIRLRTQTRPLHEAVEALLYTADMQSGRLSVGAYQHLLQIHYLFHHELEAAIGQHPGPFAMYAPHTRRKTPALLADFAAMGLPLPKLVPVGMANWSVDALLGAAYVSEGSTLGLTVVGQALKNNPALHTLTDAMSFYAGYGADTGRQWKAFGQVLGTVSPDRFEAVVVGAEAAFRRYQQLFAETHPGTNT